MTRAAAFDRTRLDGRALVADLRPLLEARRLMRRPDAVAMAMADPNAARSALRCFLDTAASAAIGVAADLAQGSPCSAQLRQIAPSRRESADIVYVHGGGLVFHDVESFRPLLEQVAARTGRGVIAIDYPKAPEHATSAIVASVDCALRAIASSGQPFILAGDSVGALLALHFALAAAGARIERLVLIYPVLNLREDRQFPSYAQFGRGHALDCDFMAWFRILAADALSTDFDPLHLPDGALEHLPTTIVAGAECDVLADEGRCFVNHLRRRGRTVQYDVYGGMPHDFLLYGLRSASAARASTELIDACFQSDSRRPEIVR